MSYGYLGSVRSKVYLSVIYHDSCARVGTTLYFGLAKFFPLFLYCFRLFPWFYDKGSVVSVYGNGGGRSRARGSRGSERHFNSKLNNTYNTKAM